jgi:hypothetical protein
VAAVTAVTVAAAEVVTRTVSGSNPLTGSQHL